MSITAAFVLFAVLWFMTLLLLLPLRLVSQAEAGEVVPGTHAGAPTNPNIKRKAFWATIIATVLWVILFYVITSGMITVRDIDFMGRMPPAPTFD